VTDASQVRLTGQNDTLIWGMSSSERVRRLIAQETKKCPIAEGCSLHINLDYVFDPLLLRLALKMPETAFVKEGESVIGQWAEAPAETIDLSTNPSFYNEQLRKKETPFAMRLTPETRYSIERASYFGAYKGVTDLLTKYLWPELAFHLTRLAAALKMTPNMVTAIGAVLCVVATFLFSQGMFWTGTLAGFIFMVLDTVDGKLARCTITSSKWGNIFDHGIDLVHPPFWWVAWAMGLKVVGLGMSQTTLIWVMVAILGGYVVQRLIEGVFMRMNGGMHIHIWRPFDSWFRLITARRNPNMVILVASLLVGRPDIGLVAVAWWTVVSLGVHTIQLAQMMAAKSRGKAITSWLEQTS
jgi:phosphatidylglycerophosphate synthase